MAMKRSTVPQEPGQALGVLAGESWRMGHFLSSSRITYQFFISITLLVVNGRSHGPVTADTPHRCRSCEQETDVEGCEVLSHCPDFFGPALTEMKTPMEEFKGYIKDQSPKDENRTFPFSALFPRSSHRQGFAQDLWGNKGL